MMLEDKDFSHSPYHFPIRRPVLATMLVLTLLVFGLLSFRLLPVNMMPEISYPSITVRTEYAGSAPEEVEQVITYPLEQSLGVLRNLVEINSSSRAGFSDIELEFAWNTDMNRATQDVREKLDLVFLPQEVQPPLILRYDPTLDPLIRISLTSDSLKPRDLRDLAERIVKTELEKLTGVAAVRVRGGEETEIRVEINSAALDLLNITIDQVKARIAAENVNMAGGRLKDGQTEYILRTLSEFQSLDDISGIAIDKRGGEIIRLRDIANVSLASKEITNITRSGGKESVELEVFRESDANPVSVSDAVKNRMYGKEPRGASEKTNPKRNKVNFRRGPATLQDVLTQRISIDIISDQAEFLRRAIREVESAAVWGAVLAVIVLFLFLGNLLDTLIVAVVIPVSLVSAFAAMNYWHVTLNVMSLGGLALGVGMMVDNSIVVVESIFRRRAEGDSVEKAAVNGTRIVGGAVIASTLTTVVVFFPVVFVTGIAGQIFSDLSMSVIIALVASLLVALFYVPMLVVRLRTKTEVLRANQTKSSKISFALPSDRFRSGIAWWKSKSISMRLFSSIIWIPYLVFRLILEYIALLVGFSLGKIVGVIIWFMQHHGLKGVGVAAVGSKHVVGKFNGLFERFGDKYLKILSIALKSPRYLVILIIVLSIATIYLLLPRLGSELIPDVSQGIFDVKITSPVGTAIQKTDEIIEQVETKISSMPQIAGISSRVGSDPTDPSTLDEGTHTGRLTVRLKPGANLPEREAVVVYEIRKIVALIPSVTMTVTHPALFSFKQPVELVIKGEDLNQLKSTSNRLQSAIQAIPNISDMESTIRPGNPEVVLQFNRELLAHLNITQKKIAELIRSSVLGDVPTKFREADRHIDIRVNFREADRDKIDDLANLVINPGENIPVCLKDVARIDIMEGPAEIHHTGGVRSSVISAGISGLDLGGVTHEIEAVISQISIPADLTLELGGQRREMENSLTSLYWALLLAVFLVYVVMASQFESFTHPLLIIFTIPFAVIGVIPVLWFLNIPISIMVFLGLIVLAGIVVNNSIVLVDYTNQLRRSGKTINYALLTSARSRLRPILMTTLTTMLGLLPMAIGLGEGAEMRRPMAITVMAGLIIGTITTLILIPAIYRLVAREMSNENIGNEVLE